MYLAHISEDKTREQSLRSHSAGVSKWAGDFADVFGCREWGAGVGLCHDIGKYTKGFDRRLHGGPKVDHATAGAKELYLCKNLYGAYCIAGHHSGLPDGGTVGDAAGMATLRGRMEKTLEDYSAYKTEVEIPRFPDIPLRALGKGGFTLSFFIRMLFSCLVDADYLDTEEFMTGGTENRGGCDSMGVLWDRLQKDIEKKKWLENQDLTTVNGRRSAILRACIEQGKEPQGIRLLTVPTGGGKTVASLAFALRQAAEHGLTRVIYVIPYTSIIEQNAQVFKDILGKENVLEDHCNVVYEDETELKKAQLAAENWDRPVVVTTNVQFFESFYSNKTSKCRKLHNVANSVIIFDEAQMLPVNDLKPCLQVISELVYNYHCTAVICTATQPALGPFFPEQLRVREICPDVKEQYDFFRRTEMKHAGQLCQDGLVELLRREEQVLCILNSRKRVQRVYEELKGEGVYHLSTFQYPNHRKRILKEIRARLKGGKPCKLIATSLVEAGVDFDFKTVFRELAGVDSVIQAAGRCNREGKRPRSECKTVVFTLEAEDDVHIPRQLKLPISVAKQTAGKWPDLMSLEAIHEYFHLLYHYKGKGLDGKGIVGRFEEAVPSFSFPFATIAEEFHLIENETKTILIDKEQEAAELVQRIRWGECSRQLVRDAGHFCVNVYPQDFERLNGAGRLEALDLGFYILRNKEMYTEDMGLLMDAERGDAVLY